MKEDQANLVHAVARRWPMRTVKVLLGTIAVLLGVIAWGGEKAASVVIAKLENLDNIAPRFEKIEIQQQAMKERQDVLERNVFELAKGAVSK